MASFWICVSAFGLPVMIEMQSSAIVMLRDEWRIVGEMCGAGGG